MESIDVHDILVIGGGAAGLRAAVAAVEKNPQLSVALISKVYPIRSHTVSAEGGAAAVLRDYDDFDAHAFDTIKGSDYLADQDAVEFFVRECPKELATLEQWGCPWSRDENGDVAVRAFGGMSVKRTVYAADKTGFYMLHSLFERSLKYEQIVRYDEWFVTKLLTDDVHDGLQVTGVVAINQRTGERIAFSGKAVVLATGGAGKTYRFTTNGNIKTGDGMAIALHAGAALKDMEFVQFHPTGLVRTGILITEAARGEGGYLINKNGDRFLKDYLPTKMELGPRDLISRAIMSEIEAGRGIETKYGPCVHLDLRHLGEKLIDERLPLIREISIDYQNVDPVKEPIPVRPVLHYFMGGVHTNIRAETTLQGLYAAGETACVTINGANRLGSNSLSECLVFGRVAGEQAAAFVTHDASSAVLNQNQVLEEEARLEKLMNADGQEKVSVLREEMNDTMEQYAGIRRDANRLKQGLENIKALQERFLNVGLSDHSAVFNTEFMSILELDHMLTVCETLIMSALVREESRGSHVRDDFSDRNDQDFLYHQLIILQAGRLMFSDHPVVITKWEPKERTY